jgi:hypothetical protein
MLSYSGQMTCGFNLSNVLIAILADEAIMD